MSDFAMEEPVQPSELPVQPSELPVQPSELRRLFTTFGYLVAKQGATAVLGLAYWAVATHLFSARDVGLAAAASSAAFFLGAIGGLGIPLLLLAELDSFDGRGPPRHLQHRDVHRVFGCPDPVVGHAGPLPVPGRQPEDHRCTTRRPPLSS